MGGRTCDWCVLANQACKVAQELAEWRSLLGGHIPACPDNILEKKRKKQAMAGVDSTSQ